MSIFHKIKLQFLNQELSFQATRSSGPGGQNVNKVNSKVILKFNVAGSQLLEESEKAILMKKWAKKLDNEGNLIIQTQEKRSQVQNKTIALRKFYSMLDSAFQKRKTRKPPGPGREPLKKGSKPKKLGPKRRREEVKNGIDIKL
jgi:ribosome-associated protein